MDKVKLLQARRKEVLAASKNIRNTVSELVDPDSFVEVSGFSFSKNDTYEAKEAGEGVVAGFATIDGYPIYVVAQNFETRSGGISKENCAKILRCLELSEKNSTPVVYILNSHGVQIDEGISVLDSLGSILAKSAKLHGVVPQFAIVKGDLYGQSALLAANSDYTFFMKESILVTDSPLVISAKSGKNLPKEEVGGAKALNNTNLVSFECSDVKEIRSNIFKILDVMPDYGGLVIENGSDLNQPCLALNNEYNGDDLIVSVFDKDTFVETNQNTAPDTRCILGRIGGISTAAIVFDSIDGVSLNALNISKINSFVEFAAYYNLPFITFVNTLGIKSDLETNNSPVLKNIFKLMESYDLLENAKISVVYKKAIGLGYTLFASKSMGYDYNFAFADAKISLFDSLAGAEIELSEEKDIEKSKLAARYSEETADPMNSAKNGAIDNIIEPQFVKQYLVASLQMLIK